MDLMGILGFIVVGLIAGFLASRLVFGKGRGWLFDIIIGIVGAFVGGWIFRQLHVAVPIGGLGGVILVAFIGAVVLLFALRVIRSATRPKAV